MEHAMKRQAARILITLALLAMAGSGLAGGDSPPRLRRAPDFVLHDFLGNKVSLADFRGRVVLLQFFQTGCPACQHEAPLLEELHRKFKDKGVVVIGVSHDTRGTEAVKQFAKQYDLTYFLVIGDLEVAVRYIGITPQQSSFDIPRFFLIDREGYIVKDIDPVHDPEFLRNEKGALEQAINEVLGRPRPPRPQSTAPSR